VWTDIRARRALLPKCLIGFEDIEFIAAIQKKTRGAVNWQLELAPLHLQRIQRIVRKAAAVSARNGELESAIAALQAEVQERSEHEERQERAIEKLLEGQERNKPDWMRRKKEYERRFDEIKAAEGAGSVRAMQGGLPSLGKRS
jgi:hypothetical protein